MLNRLQSIDLLWNWRYWPMELLYLPLTVSIICIGSLRTGRLFYFAAANPKVPLGGFAGDSKYAIIRRIPPQLRPKTLFVSRNEQDSQQLLDRITEQFTFPIIAKPDIGEGGFLVRKLATPEDWKTYHAQHAMSYLIQECIDLPLEFSILVHEANGALQISGITEKRYATLTGDGSSTVGQLLYRQKNTRYCRKQLRRLLGERLLEIPAAGEIVQPLQIGNWKYGALYFHRPELNTAKLTQVMKTINEQIGLFHYARYDLKCASVAALTEGRLSILEINGVKGEAIHIYDPKNTLAGAYREIFRHWKFIRKISMHHLDEGIGRTGMREGFRLLRQHRVTQKASQKPRISP